MTDRETEVARLVEQGMTNAEIATELFITPKAVDYHLGNIYAKFGLKDASSYGACSPSRVADLSAGDRKPDAASGRSHLRQRYRSSSSFGSPAQAVKQQADVTVGDLLRAERAVEPYPPGGGVEHAENAANL